MSDLLQRLIDRTREPLSAVRPILPSIYTPADKTENDGGGIFPANLAPEPTAHPSTSPADERGIHEGSPAKAEERGETRPNLTRPTLSPSETDAQPRPPVTKPWFRPGPPDLKSTLQRTDGGIAPAINPPARAETVSSPPETKPAPSAAEKTVGNATGSIYPSITKTVVPRGLVAKNPLLSTANKAAATIRKISPWPMETASATPKEIKAASSAFQTGQGEATPLLEASATKAAIPPSQGQPSESREAPATKTIDSMAASSRELNDAKVMASTNRESFSARQSERNSKKSPQNDDRAPPVEVHVSIGHIEVKSAQPQVPAQRRTPSRPRVTLDEFLKRPHYGGPL
jgi:hypothetical protein